MGSTEKDKYTAKGIMKALRRAQERVHQDIAGHTSHGGVYARGLASEGYAGGYEAALMDVELVLRGGLPCVRPEYWPEYGDDGE